MLTEYTKNEEIIIRIIKPHKDFASTINQHEIAIEFMEARDECISGRAVRKIIEKLIEGGCPIISTPVHPNGGYAWGGNDGEALECYKRLRHKGIMIMIRARRILRNELNRKGQGELF